MDKARFAIILCRQRALARAVLALALAAVLIATAYGGAEAEDDDLFQVLDVKVDEIDQTAAAARDKALATGERRAWDALLQRLVDPQQRRPLSEFSRQEIGDAVKDFWVTEEKTSPVRYIATLNYNFRPPTVRRLLGARGVRFTMIRSKPVVVVPIYATGSETRLWEPSNPWRDAWKGVRSGPLLPLRVPAGDAGDVAVLGVEQALTGDHARLAELAQRNGGEDVLVTVATLGAGGDAGGHQIKVSSTRYTPTGPQPLSDRTLPIDGADGEAEGLRQAAAAVAADLDAAWRRGTATLARPTSRTTVVVPTGTLESWVDMRRRLIALPQAERVSVLSLTREEARVLIVYPGSPEQMGAALARSGLVLRNENGTWMIFEAGATAAEGATPQDGAMPQ